MAKGIGTLNEKPLHAALKQWYAQPGDRFEVPVEGFVVDIVRGDLLIEIQTRNLSAIRRKLLLLTAGHPLRLIYPIAQEKWIVRLGADGETVVGRRRSPKRGSVELIFDELVSVPRLLHRYNFSLEAVLVEEEEVRRPDSTVNWRRRGWAVQERRLLRVVGQQVFATPAELAALLPADLPQPFTTRELAQALGRPLRLAQRMAYCLREMGVLDIVGKSGKNLQYRRTHA